MKKIRVAALVFLGLALIGVGVAIVTSWGSWVTLREQAAGFGWQARPLRLFASLALGVAALLATGGVWAILFRGAGGSASPREAAAAWLGSNLGRYLPGKVWQLTGITAWFAARGDSGAAGFATSLALQAIMLVTGAGLGVAFGGEAVADGVSPLLAGGLAVPLVLLLHPRVLDWVVRRVARLIREPEPGASVGGAAIARSAVGAVGIWFVYGVGLALLIDGLAPGHAPPPHVATGVFAAAYVAGYVVLIAPGGLLVREGATGRPAGPAAAIAIAARLWTTAAELAALGLAGIGLRGGRSRG